MSKTLNSVAKTPAPRAVKPAKTLSDVAKESFKPPVSATPAQPKGYALNPGKKAVAARIAALPTHFPGEKKGAAIVAKQHRTEKPASPFKPLQATVPTKDARQYTTRMAKADRSNQILSAALKVAGKVGYIKMTRADVAAQASVSECLITRYFATMDALRDAVVQSVQRECLNDDRPPVPANLRILAEALVAKHKDASKAAKKHKDAIVALLFK